jgi:hypothetical protein
MKLYIYIYMEVFTGNLRIGENDISWKSKINK